MFPQKKQESNHSIIIFSLIVGLLIGGYLVLTSKVSLGDIINTSLQKTDSQQNIDNNDDDHDGLTNKEESFYKTDPRNKDTDGDGFADGEEILAKRDPLKSGPNDKLNDINANDPVSQINQNMTNAIGLKLFTGIQTNQIYSDDSSAQIFDFLNPSLNAEIKNYFQFPEISINDLKLISDNSQEAIGEYNKSIAQIIKNNFTAEQFSQSIIDEISIATETNNFSKFKEYEIAFKNSFEEVKRIPTPSNLIQNHKNLLKILWLLQISSSSIEQANQDPMKAMTGIQNIESAVMSLLSQLSQK